MSSKDWRQIIFIPMRTSRVLALVALFVAGPVAAVDLGTPSLFFQGFDQFGTAVGSNGAPVLGNIELTASVVGDLVGQGGNTITPCFPDLLASVTATFSMTSAKAPENTLCSSVGTQTVAISATNAAGVCSDIQNSSFNQGCQLRAACTNSGSPGRLMDIVGPSFCITTNWKFLTGAVPAAPTRVQISGLTNALAATVDFFSLQVGPTLIETAPFSPTFAAVSTVAQLASAIGGLHSSITASAAGSVLTITAASTGPTAFSGLRLEKTTAATTTLHSISGLDDAAGAAANVFTLNIDGAGVNQSGVNFAGATDLTTLAAQLSVIPGITVSNLGGGILRVAASNPGARVFSGLSLRSIPVLTDPTVSTLDYTENEPPAAIQPVLGAGHPHGASLNGGLVQINGYVPGQDILDCTAPGPLACTFASGLLLLSGNASPAAYQTALRSVVYSNLSEAPDTTPRSLTLSVQDAQHSSLPVHRPLNVISVNDIPVLVLGPSIEVLASAGPQSLPGWLDTATPGPDDESTQLLTFDISTSDDSLFDSLPDIDVDGTLSFTPKADFTGEVTVSVILRDDAGIDNNGRDATEVQTFLLGLLRDPINPGALDAIINIILDEEPEQP